MGLHAHACMHVMYKDIIIYYYANNNYSDCMHFVILYIVKVIIIAIIRM